MTRSPAAPVSRPVPDGPATTAPASPAPPRRRVLIAWILDVTRPVLRPLAASAACRVADLLAGVGLFSLGAATIMRLGGDLAAGRPAPMPWGTLLVMALLALAKAVLRYGEQFLGHLVAFKSLELLRAEIFRALVPRAPRVMATSRSGDLLARATKDVDRIEVFFAHTFAPVVSAVIVPLVVVGVVGAAVSWTLAGLAALFLLGSLLLAPLAGWRTSLSSSRDVTARRALLTQHVTDSVQGMAEVVGYGRRYERLEEMGQIDQGIIRAGSPGRRWMSLRRGLTQLLTLGGPVAVAASGTSLVRAGSVSAPALAATVAALLRLTETVRGIEELTGSLNASFAAAERVHAVVHAPVEVPDGTVELPHAVAHEVTWEDVSYSYPGAATQAVTAVSATARAGAWTCLVGASGSGKSTLAQLLLRFDDPTAGRVEVDGQDVRELTGDSLRREVVLVTQRAHLFRASVADNVRLAAPQASDEDVRQACRAAGIEADILAMPQGYDTLVGERGASVSGGQRQRLALARALLARPSVLVLDEFTSHLDPALDAQVRASVREWTRGSTVIEITHRLSGTELADHVVVMDDGRVLEAGTAEELASHDGAFSRLRRRERVSA